MRRTLIALVAVALVVAACGDDGVLTGSGSEPTTGPTSGPTTEAPGTSATTTSTTVPPTTTPTTLAATTTVPTTTTTTTTVVPAPVTSHASLPGGALGRHLIPWSEVDGDWVLALYRGDDIVNWSDGPAALYLADPDGTYYEITAWPATARRPWLVLDWSGDHTRALVRVYPNPAPDDDHQVVLVDLVTGQRHVVFSAPATTWQVDAAFTQPTGKNIVVSTDDGTTERLEIHRSGSGNAVLVDRPSQTDSIYWLYGQSGTTVVVSDVDGMRLLDNQGSLIRGLDTPGYDCRVPRWWGGNEVLAACVPPAEWAAGNHYHQLWRVPVDGSAATAITSVPGGIIVVDFGIIDARRTGGETVTQWSGDCSAASVQILQPDGFGVSIPTTYPVLVAGVAMVGTQGPRLAVLYWDDCGQTQSWLGQIDLDGTFRGELIPKVADTSGVVSAIGG